ncbi:hypothetical protein [Alloprevotella tannerae]|uniref:hypothetical protein n=1 Tax=Alloprevotella tannerae TaxID=76122 RepID=UPI00361AA350
MRYFVPIEGIIEGKCLTQDHFFLLALFDLIEDGVIIDNKISFNSDILKETYQNKAISFKRYNPITPFYKPFFILIVNLIIKSNGKQITSQKVQASPPSAKFLRENVEYASLDDDLWQLLQEEDARNEIKEDIISYFIEPIKELK